MGMGAWGWDCGDESMGMGDWGWQNFSCLLSKNDPFCGDGIVLLSPLLPLPFLQLPLLLLPSLPEPLLLSPLLPSPLLAVAAVIVTAITFPPLLPVMSVPIFE